MVRTWIKVAITDSDLWVDDTNIPFGVNHAFEDFTLTDLEELSETVALITRLGYEPVDVEYRIEEHQVIALLEYDTISDHDVTWLLTQTSDQVYIDRH